MWQLRYGATVVPEGVEFRVWAPRLREASVVLKDSGRLLPMQRECDGDFAAFVPGLQAGADYAFVTESGAERPDPVSRFQPRGVHGPSRVINPHSFSWSDRNWKGLPLKSYIIYELHTGTFTPEGTFEAIIPKLGYLRDLGVTAIELMPVAQFPGQRNWGYDGVAPYAPQSTYGGPDGLKKLVDACHREGLAMVLDVVYNHLGPEGNYLAEFGPFFTDSYRTPWGSAINYDGPDSDGVRRYFIENALYWLTEYHIDALRLDAIHGIFDFGARHILEELADAFHGQARDLGRDAWIIAESDLNDVRILKPVSEGGYGVDSQWNDDFHHAFYTALTGDTHGYFTDFGRLEDLAKSLQEGFVYDGRRSAYRRRRHGSSSKDRPGEQFVVFTQNHDQIANALGGKRLASLVTTEQQKLAAAVLLLSPFVPLLFMGQEYGEIAPFHYFTDHSDAALAAAVREGRRREHAALHTGEDFFDPQDAGTLEAGKLQWELPARAPHHGILQFYRDLLKARKTHPCLANCRKDLTQVSYDEERRWMVIGRGDPSGARAVIACNFLAHAQPIPLAVAPGDWSLLLWSGSPEYGGPGSSAAPDAALSSIGAAPLSLEGSSVAVYLRKL